MSISYSGIIGNKGGKGSIPSVESWGTNNNILRDPPKSITTRRIDKVNQDGSLNEMYYHSGDRFAENISLYARGVNPMVNVEYGNVGTMKSSAFGGATSKTGSTGGATKLPYRIMNGGAFRPPQLRQEQLLPLSRQPRNVTSVQTTKEFKDYSKSALCDQQPKCFRQVHPETLNGVIAPTKTMKLQVPVREHFVVKYVIDAPRNYEVDSNKSSRTNIMSFNPENVHQASKDISQYSHSSQVRSQNGQTYMHDDITLEKNTPQYMTEAQKSSFKVNGVMNSDSIMLEKNTPQYMTEAQKSSYKVNGVNNSDSITLVKNTPDHKIISNPSDNRKYTLLQPENEYEFKSNMPHTHVQSALSQKTSTHAGSRQVNLPPSLYAGGLEGKANIPQKERNINYNANYTTAKTRLAEKVRQMVNV